MSRFDDALQYVLRAEGGYGNDARDPGGKTRFGITEAVARAHGYTGDMRDLPLDLARDIYRQDYWDACKCEQLPWPLSCVVFDAAVNQGSGAAIKMLQRALGVEDDGVIGPATLRAAQSQGSEASVRLLTERALRYTKTNNFDAFGRGWINRLFGLALSV